MLLALVLSPLLGAIVGSTTNAFVPRLARGEGGYLTERSRCPHCKTTLRPQHLVPVLSYLVLRGRCASCHVRIPLQYLIVEIVGALTFLLLAYAEFHAADPSLLRLSLTLLLAASLLALSAYDALTMELPLVLLVPAIVLAALRSVVAGAPSLTSALIGAAVAAGFFGLQIAIATPLYRMRARRAGQEPPEGVVGSGDAVLALVPGIAVGWPGIVAALGFAYLLGALVTIPLLSLGTLQRERMIPFGPFLAAGTVAGILWSASVTDWYLRLIGF